MKLGIFTDSHYSSAEVLCGVRFNSKSLGKIKIAMEHFKKENCDLVVCLGDVTDYEDTHEKEVENLRAVSKVLKESGLKTYIVMGNHDGFAFCRDDFYGIVGKEFIPENITVEDKKLIFLDTCFFDNGKRYAPGDDDWTNSYLKDTDGLEKDLCNAPDNVYVFMHHNIDPEVWEDHRVKNSDEIIEILKKSGKVKTVFQGHCHPGHKSVYDGIEYVTLPAMCEREDAYYVFEI